MQPRRSLGAALAGERRNVPSGARAWSALLIVTCLLGVLPGAAAAQQPVQASPTAIDGPTSDIVRPSGLDLATARDGSGGLVYLKQVGGTPHVFVSTLEPSGFQAPVQVDSSLGGASSQPVIAASNAGALVVAFINGGELYAAWRVAMGAPLTSPVALAGGASNPSLSISNLGKAYLAFATADRGGYDVRTAYYYNGHWGLEAPPLNAQAADNAGTGSGAPEVAAAGDGVAIVAWGENGHIYSRRVWGTSPSVAFEQADAPPAGCTEASASQPAVGAGGDSSFAPVAFHEQVTCGGHQQSRVFTNRLHASTYDGITNADGLSGAPADGAHDPQVAVTEYGQGWVTSQRTASNAAVAQDLRNNGSPGGAGQLNSLPITAPPVPVPATAGLYSTFVAWQQSPGTSGPSEIRVRYAPDGSTLGPELVASTPAQGPIDAADGISAAGDVYGEAAVAWLQGAPGASTVMVEQMYQTPGPFLPKALHYARTPQPVFAWTRPHAWGPMRYSLVVDGAPAGQTYGPAAPAAAPLPDGPHVWQVLADNPVGQESRTKPAQVFIDTVAPRATLKLRTPAVLGSKLQANLSYLDPSPPGAPRSHASGLASVSIQWGDRTTTKLRVGTHVIRHVYRHAGSYRVRVVVTDRAGNAARLVGKLKVVRSLPNGKGKHTTLVTFTTPPPATAPAVPSGGASKVKAKRRLARSRARMARAKAGRRAGKSKGTPAGAPAGRSGPGG